MTFKQQVKALRKYIEEEINLDGKLDDLAQDRWGRFNDLSERAQQGIKGQQYQHEAEKLEEAVGIVMELIQHLEELE